jgi:hypothetical protein
MHVLIFKIPFVNLHNPFPDKLIMTQMLDRIKRTAEQKYQHDRIKQQKLLEVSCSLD